ncbi:hypothetical protein ACQW5G_04245 [Fructilactobacillus sp. Tb1]|uniref:hypothetical protein n=1 Tax=Fructilactobacillus sp. Tb1 TaxID=3422304 RepID=UPI003D2D9E9E
MNEKTFERIICLALLIITGILTLCFGFTEYAKTALAITGFFAICVEIRWVMLKKHDENL